MVNTSSLIKKFAIAGLALFAVLALVVSVSGKTKAETVVSLSTDKTKYSVGETMIISGAGFSVNTPVNIVVLTPKHNTNNLSATADANGAFSASYTPAMEPGRYKITATDGVNTAEVASTEADAVATDISQCQNGGVGGTLQPCNETPPGNAASGYGYEGNAAANSSNSHWTEGDFVPLRIVGTGYSAGPGNIQFSIDITKGGKHAYDYVGSFDQTETTSLSASSTHANHNNPCGDIISGCDPTTPDSQGLVPAASLSPFSAACGSATFVGSQVSGNIKAWGTSGPLAVTYVSENVGSSDCTTTIQVAWTNTKVGFGGTIVIGYAAHIAKQADWGTGNSAINISGSPYHSSLVSRTTGGDTKGIGNQDAKLAASAIVVSSTITIHKVTQPNASDPTSFTFNTTGTGYSGFSLTGGHQNQQTITGAGNYSVTEVVPSTWSNTGLSCTASGAGSSATPNLANHSVAITIGSGGGASIDCIYTNTLQQGHLTLQKTVVNDNGGNAVDTDWTLNANGSTPISGVEGNASVTNAAVNAGNYDLSESNGPSGYTMGSWNCGAATMVDADTVTVPAGGSITCVITNNDNAPSLKLIKHVINDNGGTTLAGAWTLNAGTHSVSGSESAIEVTNQAGTYALSESSVAGYTNTSTTCDNNVGVQVTSVTIGLGQTIICTFVNNDNAPSLKLKKHVVNDNGGLNTASDWTLNAGAHSVTGSETATEVTNQVGTYALSESVVAGYTNTSITCDDNPGTEVTSVTIGLGQIKTCTFVNNDNAPSLKLIKHVVNNNGGTKVASDWTLHAGAHNVTGSETAVEVTNQAGTYNLSESSVTGYANTSITCDNNAGVEATSVTIGLGETITCTFVNDDIAPSLKLKKHVVNDNGGTAIADAWTLSAGSNNVTGSETATQVTDQTGSYDLSETSLAGYANTSITCDNNPNAEVTSVTINLGETITCTFVNDDIAPSLKLAKHVINNNGGTTLAGAWTLNAGAHSVTGSESAVEVTNQAGTYNLSESSLIGYTNTSITCDDNVGAEVTSVTIGLGQTKTCTFVNDDQPAHLIVIKHVINHGGSAVAGDFTTHITGVTTAIPDAAGVESPGVDNTLTTVGSYGVDETANSDYTKTLSTDCSGTIALGQTKTCTVTNEEKTATLTIVKDAQPNDCQDFSFALTGQQGFALDDDQDNASCGDTNQPLSKTFSNLNTGSVTITETEPNSFWTLGSATCVLTGTTTPFNSNLSGTALTLTLTPGVDVTCTFVNNKLSPTRTLGFWQTHTAFTSTTFASAPISGNMPIGTAPHKGSITSTAQLFGGFFANVAKDSNGKKRQPIDQARMQLLQQLIAAKLNCAAFGCSGTIVSQITNADNVYYSGTPAQILAAASQLDAYNNSGDTLVVPNTGSATPQTSKTLADIAFWNLP